MGKQIEKYQKTKERRLILLFLNIFRSFKNLKILSNNWYS